MKRYIKSGYESEYVIEVLEEDEDGNQNIVKTTGTPPECFIDCLRSLKTHVEVAVKDLTLDSFLDAIEYSGDNPGYWMIIQVKINGEVVAGLSDDELS